jgi:hypothetical protein
MDSLFHVAVESGLTPTEFDLKRGESRLDWSGIFHRQSKSHLLAFCPDFNVTRKTELRSYVVEAVVGNDEKTRYEGLKWVAVEQVTRAWVGQVKRQDVWTGNEQVKDAFTAAQGEKAGNAPFTKDEQMQITAQLQGVKEQLKEQFELTSEQIAHIDERLNEAAEATERMGRKDWLLLFGGTIFNLIVTDTVTPSVAGHIFTTVIHGLIHLFTGTGGPPQILA